MFRSFSAVHKLTGIAAVFWLLLITERVWSQSGSPSVLLQEAQAERDDGFFQEALVKFQKVSQDAPRTTEDLYSRLERARYYFGTGNKEVAKQLYASIVQDFPTRSESVLSRINLADIRYIDENGSFPAYLSELDTIAVSLGGPKVSLVSSGGDGRIRSVAGFSEEVQSEALAELYDTAASRFVAKKAGVSRDDIDRNLNLLVYMAETFPGVLGEQFQEQLVGAFQRRDGVSSIDPSSDRSPPKIFALKVRTRASGGRVIVTSVSDNLLIFPRSVDILLDGQKIDAEPLLRFRPLNKNPKHLRVESLRIVIKQPLPALAPGRHQVVCTATDGAGNVASKSRYFRVRNESCDAEGSDAEDENGDDFLP